jgi:(p)ppGpp synthase/HD superfamily hydrolase
MILERAILIATKAHEGQVDKGGAPYILHPLRVMLNLHTLEEQIVGVLHDVLEDTSITIDYLRIIGFSETILIALQSITKHPKENYEDFIIRVAANKIGRQVKLADLQDNSDISRIPFPTEKDFKRIEKYRKAIEFLIK